MPWFSYCPRLLTTATWTLRSPARPPGPRSAEDRLARRRAGTRKSLQPSRRFACTSLFRFSDFTSQSGFEEHFETWWSWFQNIYTRYQITLFGALSFHLALYTLRGAAILRGIESWGPPFCERGRVFPVPAGDVLSFPRRAAAVVVVLLLSLKYPGPSSSLRRHAHPPPP